MGDPKTEREEPERQMRIAGIVSARLFLNFQQSRQQAPAILLELSDVLKANLG